MSKKRENVANQKTTDENVRKKRKYKQKNRKTVKMSTKIAKN